MCAGILSNKTGSKTVFTAENSSTQPANQPVSISWSILEIGVISCHGKIERKNWSNKVKKGTEKISLSIATVTCKLPEIEESVGISYEAWLKQPKKYHTQSKRGREWGWSMQTKYLWVYLGGIQSLFVCVCAVSDVPPPRKASRTGIRFKKTGVKVRITWWCYVKTKISKSKRVQRFERKQIVESNFCFVWFSENKFIPCKIGRNVKWYLLSDISITIKSKRG